MFSSVKDLSVKESRERIAFLSGPGCPKHIKFTLSGKKPLLQVFLALAKLNTIFKYFGPSATIYINARRSSGSTEYKIVLPCRDKVLKQSIANLRYRTTAKCFN